MKILTEFFQEDNGGMSMTRLMVFFVIVIPFLIWAGICLYHWQMTEMPTSVVTVQTGAWATKLVQKQQESKAPVEVTP